MKKQILLFDIDLVIFDFDKFSNWRDTKVKEIAQLKDNNAQTILDAAKALCYKERNGYEPLHYSELIANALGRPEILPSLTKTLEEVVYENFYYPQIENVIQALIQSNKYLMGVQSVGDIQTQKRKLGRLANFFNPNYMFFYSNDKVKSLEKYLVENPEMKSRIIVIDDKPGVILQLQSNNVKTIWVKQGKYAAKATPEEQVLIRKKVNSIDQLIPLLTNQSAHD